MCMAPSPTGPEEAFLGRRLGRRGPEENSFFSGQPSVLLLRPLMDWTRPTHGVAALLHSNWLTVRPTSAKSLSSDAWAKHRAGLNDGALQPGWRVGTSLHVPAATLSGWGAPVEDGSSRPQARIPGPLQS